MKTVPTLLFFAAAAFAAKAGPLWPGGDVRLEARQGATIEERDGIVYVQTGRCSPNTYPNVAFVFRKPVDLSSARAIRATFTNCTDRPLRISLKIHGETEQGQLPDSGCRVPAYASHFFFLPLFLERWTFDRDPQLLGLKRTPHVGDGSSYSLTKVTDVVAYIAATDNVRFGVSDVEIIVDGAAATPPTVLKADSFCPWVDEFGQANFAEWSDKVHSLEELRSRTAAEEAELAAHPVGIPDADRFGGWATGPQLRATGHFRTEKVAGKWWFVDPDGHLFFSHGVNCTWECEPTGVSGREAYFEKLPPQEGATKQFWTRYEKPQLRNYYGDPAHVPFQAFSFTAYDLWLKYGDDWKRRNAETAQRRMRAWGLNAHSGGIPDMDKLPRRIPFIVSFPTKSRPISGATGHWGLLQDPFAPEFEKSCEEGARRARVRGMNEWCLGWTVDNELSWGTDGVSLARDVLAAADDQPAKIALLGILASKGMTAETATDAVLRELGEAVAEKYYSTVRAAIKRVAPDILYLGDRNDKLNPETFRAASRNCDVVTVNVYNHQPTVALPPGAEDKPLLVTEFHFGCYDTGYFYASLVPVGSQRERAECYERYLLAAVDNPNYVGAHWFCWRDCPITGQVYEGANAQCGLVSTTDIPYTDLVEAIRKVSRTMYSRRFGGKRP